MNLQSKIAGRIRLSPKYLPKYIEKASYAPTDAPGRGIRFDVKRTND